jgi:hypothetical protein
MSNRTYTGGTKWEWYGAVADQGLMYYCKHTTAFLCEGLSSSSCHVVTCTVLTNATMILLFTGAKYYKKSVSLIIRDEVENWSSFPNGTVRLERVLKSPLANYTCLPVGMEFPGGWGSNAPRAQNQTPYRDFVHYHGRVSNSIISDTAEIRAGCW